MTTPAQPRAADQHDFMFVIEELKGQRDEALNKLADKGGQLRRTTQELLNCQQTVELVIQQGQALEAKLKAAHTIILDLGGTITPEAGVELVPLDSAPPSSDIPVGEPLTPH